MRFKKICLISVGCVALALGALGAVLPVLPTVPFLLLAAACFTKSSERLDTWLKSTKLYQNNLAQYAQGNGMTKKAKLRVLTLVSILMAVGFLMMRATIIGRVMLVFVWLFHMVYFIFVVKTI